VNLSKTKPVLTMAAGRPGIRRREGPMAGPVVEVFLHIVMWSSTVEVVEFCQALEKKGSML